jgi:hypothetical protein
MLSNNIEQIALPTLAGFAFWDDKINKKKINQLKKRKNVTKRVYTGANDLY